MSWPTFQNALQKCVAKKAVGIDGWNAYLLRRAPTAIQERYWHLLRACVESNNYPTEWRQWIAMISLKAGGNAHVMNTYRDLWIVPQGQKLLMRMLNVEYERVARKTIPGSQAGWSPGRACPEQVITVRIAQELAAMQNLTLCIGYQDLSTCFMSIIKQTQWAVEEYLGVDVDVTTVMQALHAEITGRYETAHGLTNGHNIGSGTGQGCANGGVRAKIGAIAPMQKAVTQLCRGFKVREGPGGSVPQVYFADDGAFLTNSLADLQAIYDINWIMARE